MKWFRVPKAPSSTSERLYRLTIAAALTSLSFSPSVVRAGSRWRSPWWMLLCLLLGGCARVTRLAAMMAEMRASVVVRS